MDISKLYIFVYIYICHLNSTKKAHKGALSTVRGFFFIQPADLFSVRFCPAGLTEGVTEKRWVRM